MTRRASLPGADELFRVTADEIPASAQVPQNTSRRLDPHPAPAVEPETAPARRLAKVDTQASKPRHDEKITFYCTAADLTRLERARLSLRADLSLPSDRGRIVRAALAEILDEFESRGAGSALVRRLESEP